MRRKNIYILAIAAIFLFAAAGIQRSGRYFEILKNLDIFASLFKEVNAYYVDEIDPGTFIKSGIDEMLGTLDPYTNYISADDIETYRMATTGEYSGIGASVEEIDGVSTVILPYQGFAAAEAGLLAGDEIHAIDGIDLVSKSREEVNVLMKGQSNSEVLLTIKRFNTAEKFDVKVKRERIAVGSVPYAGMVSDDIGYVKLTSFTPNVGRTVGIKLYDLLEKGATKIILDLRGNPGGLLHEAVNISNLFIEKGRKIVTQKGKLKENDWVYNTLNEPIDPEIPLVVLIDNGSASASEIVSGVAQDYDRGVLVGRKTFGKGLVQIERELSYDAVVKITTAKYYTPTGRCIQAIDYSNRNPDGSVGKVPDSLKNEFLTESGRKVFDGGGIDPDVEVSGAKLAPITSALLRSRLIFKYGTRYYYENLDNKPTSPTEVVISDEDYKAFKQWLKGQNFAYSSFMQDATARLIERAKEENHYQSFQKELRNLQDAVATDLDEDLDMFRQEISYFLCQDIAGRFFLEEGRVQASFQQDKDVQKAISLLNDMSTYEALLKSN
ncbi:MAG: S41 family peptidase [Bacteroidota bacterium]